MMTNAEEDARRALDWAIGETPLRLPPMLRQAGGWLWDAADASLFRLRDEGDFRFHIAAERGRSGKVRIVVMSISDDEGRATWEANMPLDLPQPA